MKFLLPTLTLAVIGLAGCTTDSNTWWTTEKPAAAPMALPTAPVQPAPVVVVQPTQPTQPILGTTVVIEPTKPMRSAEPEKPAVKALPEKTKIRG